MPGLFERQTLNREVTGLVGPEQAPPVDTGQGGVPGLGVQGVPRPPSPELQTRNIEIQGPNRGINLVADFLTGFGGGPGAATQQQAQRSAQTERLFGAQERQVNLRSQQAQQTFQNQLGQERLGLEKRRLRLAENKTVVDFDPRTGSLIAFNPRDVGEMLKRGEDPSSAIFQGSTRDSQGVTALFGLLTQGLTLSKEEQSAGLAALAEAQQTNQIGPITKFLSGIAAGKRSKDKIGSFFPLVDETGVVQAFFNPKTKEMLPSPRPGLRKSPLPAQEQVRRANLSNMLEQLEQLESLIKTDEGIASIGPIIGRISAVRQATVGDTREATLIFQIANDVADQLLRVRSGAQINEQEFQRLRTLLPDPKRPLSDFKIKLQQFKTQLRKLLEKSTGGKRLGQVKTNGSALGSGSLDPTQ